MLELAPAVGYTHPTKGYLIDVCSQETGVPLALENLLHNGYADATGITVSIEGPEDHETREVTCGICSKSAIGIKHVSASALACPSCRKFHLLTAL